MTMQTFSIDDPIAQYHSNQLLTLIHQDIVAAGGKISFADYMQRCLYSPGLGYYSAGSHKLGLGGDFTTAPELSPLFGRTLANHIQDVAEQLEQFDILEFGAGSGKMAEAILIELDQKQTLPDQYYIIEASADLRQRQEQLLSASIPHLFKRIIWLDSLPAEFSGIILANEVCDAMPVHCLNFNKGIVNERYVSHSNDQLHWTFGELSTPDLLAYSEEIISLIGDSEVTTEVNLAANAWLRSLAASLQQGAIFIIDYGYPKASYYLPQRSMGTLMCYYQHQGHDNPLILQGLQDITAHIDFTALAQTALNNGLSVAGFQSQADFLLAGGLTDFVESQHDTNAVKQLTLPSAMGETFKVLSLSKDLPSLLTRLQQADRRYTL